MVNSFEALMSGALLHTGAVEPLISAASPGVGMKKYSVSLE